ncbi:thermonuclease family protein [Salidesulfovibrio brasiliensis]|uniref:thermonuclease family protein n=1 Tax=Salidesulfovibrio brasiliensis TaxID=221711 RepID=UPI0006CF4EA7|nr:thermonuclease family protein [Salidesulfovibrio brasiliensis]
MLHRILLTLTALLLVTPPAHAGQAARYVRTIDGDTIIVNIQGWPEIIGHEIPIRLAACDTPELNDPDPEIRQTAQKAANFTRATLESAETLELRDMQRGKYFRIVCRVIVDGKDLSSTLIYKQLATPLPN